LTSSTTNVLPPCSAQGGEERALGVRRIEDHPAHLVIETAAGDGAAFLGAHFALDGEAARRQHGDRDLREPALTHLALHPRERGILGAIEPHRDDRRVGLVGDHAGAVEHLHQRAGHGDAAFGEDHQRAPLAHRLDHGLGRHRVGRIDRKRMEQAEEGLDPPALRDVGIDREGRLAAQEGAEQQAVEEAQMIDHHDGALAGLRHMLDAGHLDAV
jgi:hypothetical protein